MSEVTESDSHASVPPTTSLSPRLSLQRSGKSPLGPRYRPAPAMLSLDAAGSRHSTMSTVSRDSTLYSPGPSSPRSNDLAKISEVDSPVSTDRAPTPVRTEDSTSEHSQTSRASTPSRVQKVAATSTLSPPPEVKFESEPLKWKGLPLEAALWTFSSQELQQLVSRAIRSSAHESFIRLLSIDSLDNSIPTELERLRGLRATTQSKYRFSVQRRTMLLQALNSSVASSSSGGDELVARLAETSAECDRLVGELVRLTDQIGQLERLLDVHWASALAIALRKLNGSYGKRTSDLVAAKDRISHLEAELEEAWKEAENLAKELDERDRREEELGLSNSDSDSEIEMESTAIISKAEVVPIRTRSPPTSPPPTILTIQVKSPPPEPQPLVLTPVTRKPPPSPDDVPTTAGDTPIDTPIDESDHMSIGSARSTRSKKSTKSHRSTRSVGAITETSRQDAVLAARRRSLRTSMGSLRLPPSARKSSLKTGGKQNDTAPPVPEIPKAFSPDSSYPPSSFTYPPQPRRSFLHFDSREGSVMDVDATLGAGGSKKVNIDDLDIVPRPRPSQGLVGGIRPQSAVDDIVIMPRTTVQEHEDEEILEELRFKKPSRKSVDDITLAANMRRMELYESPSDTIPSIWLKADLPKTPAERVQSMMKHQEGSTKSSSYRKLKSFTKRYSNPFPTLMARSISSLKSSPGK